LKVRFLADANFNQKIVAGLLLREPRVDFELPQEVIPEKLEDPQVLELNAARGRIIVTHDVRTRLIWQVSEAEEWSIGCGVFRSDTVTLK
jgi:hypothetical protein